MNWKDLKLKTFKQLEQAIKVEEQEPILKNALVVQALFGINTDNLTISELGKYIKELEFLNQPCPKVLTKTKYTINGNNYNVKLDLSKLTVTQYMDYQELVKTQDYAKILTVFMIPEGHNYNDGYDIKKVEKDINDMSIIDVLAIYNFFTIAFLQCTKTLKDYSLKLMKKGKMNKALVDQISAYMESLISYQQSLNGLI